MYGLTIVSVNIFQLGKEQLADYVLETEARYVMELITQKARVAKEIEAYNSINKIKIVYHAVDDNDDYYRFNKSEPAKRYWLFSDKDVLETQYIFPRDSSEGHRNLYAERQESGNSNPITGENFFGKTHLISLQYDDRDKDKKILRIELEMESLMTRHKIKIAAAVFMPSCESLVVNDE